MNNYIIVHQDELNHFGVKGMKWGVRKDPQRAAQKERVKAAKSEYKQRKKDFNKAHRQWYNKSIAAWSPSEKHRRRNDQRFQKAMVASAKMNVAKGKYMQEKAKFKGNDKRLAKGKLIAYKAGINASYQTKVLRTMDQGYTLNESHRRNASSYSKAVKQQQDAIAKYRKKTIG